MCAFPNLDLTSTVPVILQKKSCKLLCYNVQKQLEFPTEERAENV